MSDIYATQEADPFADDPDDPLDFFAVQQQQADRRAIEGIDGDPEEAARARQLSRATGDNPTLISTDLAEYDRQYRIKLTRDLLRENGHLRDYANEDPLNAKISADDWGNLDNLSGKITELKARHQSVLSAAAKGFAVGWDSPEANKQFDALSVAMERNPLFGNIFIRQAAQATGVGLATVFRTFTGAAYGVANAVAEAERANGMNEADAARLTRDIVVGLNVAMSGQSGLHGPMVGPKRALQGQVAAHGEVGQAALREIQNFEARTHPWFATGKEPPIGVHQLIDLLKAKELETDLAKLKESLDAVLETTTKERSPESIAEVVRQHPEPNQTIGISAEAVVELYGDKMPAPGDGLLGFVPDLTQQMRTALPYGGDVQIHLTDWLAHVDPMVAKTLEPSTRPRVDGFNQVEIGLLSEWEKIVKQARAQEEPTYYHGTNKDFPEFSHDAQVDRPNGAFMFTPKRRAADNYSTVEPGGTPRVIEAKLRLKNPKEMSAEEISTIFKEDADRLKAEGYDGVVYKDKETGEVVEIGVFDKEQIVQSGRQDPVVQAVSDAAGIKFSAKDPPTGFQLIRDGELTPEQRAGDLAIRYEIHDPAGKVIGEALVALDEGGKNAHVDMIHALEGEGAIGYSGIKDLLRQLQADLGVESYSGIKTGGAGGKAGIAEPVKQKFALNEVEGIEQAAEASKARGWDFQQGDTTGRLIPTKAMTYVERQFTRELNKLIERLAGKGRVRIKYADDLKSGGEGLHGTVFTYEGSTPLIILAIDSEKLPKVARHEVVHFLREHDIITPDEWKMLEQAAEEGKWIEKHKLDKNPFYDQTDRALLLEEAISSEFGEWGASHAKAVELGAKYEKTFQKLAEFFNGIRDILTEIFGHTPQVGELFEAIELGKVAEREGGVSRTTGQPAAQRKAQQLELPQAGTTNMAERGLFSGKERLGLTAKQYDLFTKRIDEIRQGRADATAEKILKETRKRSTEQWRNDQAELRKTVETEVRARPEIASDGMYRDGILDDVLLEYKPKLDVRLLTPEQQKALPKEYYGRRGVTNADDSAALTGYASGKEMIDAMVKFNEELKQSGMRKDNFINRLIDIETERQMEAKYGKLDENIIRDAMDQVFSESQINLLAEQTVLLAEKAGLQLTLPQPKVLEPLIEGFNNSKLATLKSEAYLRASGKLGRQVETYELSQKWDLAFKAQQEQYYAATLAKEALQVEKEVEAHGKVVDRFSKREVKGVNQEYTNWIHQLLQDSGEYTGRGQGDIRHSLDLDGYKTLDDFVRSKQADGWDLDVPNDIRLRGAKPLDEMTIAEFREYRDAIKTLQHVGREVEKVEVGGRQMAFDQWKKGVIANIKTLSPRTKEKQMKGFAHEMYEWDAVFTRMEEIFKDLDLRREAGPLFKALIEPMMSSKHKEYLMQEAFSKRLSEMSSGNKEWRERLNESVPNNFFRDPDGELFNLTREHMVNIMLNFGNRSNIKKFTEGWVGKEKAATFEHQLRQLFEDHATPADWKFVREIGEIFEGWRKEADTVYHNLSGLPPKWLELEPGGWYFPIIHDRFWAHQAGKGSPFDPTYLSSTTANHYTIERTAGANRIEFQSTIEQLAGRMQQMMHDIAYREAVMQAHRIVSDKDIRAAIRTHYGQEYEKQLGPWVKDIANHFNQPEEPLSKVNQYAHKIRMNLMVHALGASIKLMLSPDVGLLNPAAIGRFLWHRDANVKLAWEHSQEIPHSFRNMDRDYREKLEGLIKDRGWAGVQAETARWAFWPIVKVSQMFRLVTFVDKFREGQAKGWTDAQAAHFADSAVRTRHGATGIPDLPAIMRDGEMMKLATTFYSYQNAMYNWQRQTVGNIRRGEWDKAIANVYGSVVISALFGAALFNEYKKDDSWGKILAKAGPIQLMSTIPFIREVSGMLVEGHPSRTPWASMIAASGSAIGDAIKWGQGKKVEKPISHAANVVGLVGGLPLAQIGRTSQFIYDVNTGKQRPRGFMQYMRGIIYGEAVKKK